MLLLVPLFAGCVHLPPAEHRVESCHRPAAHAQQELRAKFFGVSTLEISDGHCKVLVDGFFSRPGRGELLHPIGPREDRIEAALQDGDVGLVDVMLVAHSHHDHALDVGMVADKTKALLVASESTANIARGQRLANEHIRIAGSGDRVQAGQFDIELIRTPHAATPLPLPGTIPQPLASPAWVLAYREGGNYTFWIRHPAGNILIVPSADTHAKLPEGVRAGVVFLGIGELGKQGEGEIANYWQNMVLATGARLVYPIHWDDFTAPLQDPLPPMRQPFDDVARAMRMLQVLADASRVKLQCLPLFSPVTLERDTLAAHRGMATCEALLPSDRLAPTRLSPP